MALLETKRSLVLLSPDGTTPTASDFLEVQEEILIEPVIGGGDFERMTGQRNTGSQRFNDLNNVTASFTAVSFLRTNNKSGTTTLNNTLPNIANALKVSGFDETVNSGAGTESVKYSNGQTSTGGTAIVYVDGKKHTFEDGSVVGDPTFTFTNGEPAMVSTEISGYLTSAVPATEANPSITLSEEKLIIVSCIDIVTVGGDTLQVDEFTIAMNNEIINLYTLGGVDKLKSNEINDNAITMTASFFVDDADFAREYDDLESQVLQAVEIKIGTDAASALIDGTSIKITCAKVETQGVTEGEKNGRVYRTVTYRLNNNASDSDKAISIDYGTFA